MSEMKPILASPNTALHSPKNKSVVTISLSPGRRGRSAVRFRPLHPNENLYV
jgi:hypothetical protein